MSYATGGSDPRKTRIPIDFCFSPIPTPTEGGAGDAGAARSLARRTDPIPRR